MGFEDRDYIRDGAYTNAIGGWGMDFTPVVKYLIVANITVFLLQIFITRPYTPVLPADFQDALEQQHAAAKDERPDANAADPEKGQRQQDEAVRKARDMMEKMMNGLPGMRVSIVQDWFELAPEKTIHGGQLWRLVTCAFCHDRFSVWHILFNMLMLYWFGSRLERMYGSREFLLFYLAAAVSSSLAYLALAFYSGSNSPAIGASGAVMGVMMLYVIFYPFETFLLFWVIPVPLWALLAVYVLYDLHPVLLELAGDRLFTGVAHSGHLGGLAFGFLYWKLGLHLEAVFSFAQKKRFSRSHKKSTPPIVPSILPHPEQEALAERVDAVLKKISEQGADSLTDEEREFLVQASTQYRSKK